jgi:hypothetical protein
VSKQCGEALLGVISLPPTSDIPERDSEILDFIQNVKINYFHYKKKELRCFVAKIAHNSQKIAIL